MPRGYRGDGKVVSAWVSPETAERLSALGKAEDRSLSWLTGRAIEEYLERVEAALAA